MASTAPTSGQSAFTPRARLIRHLGEDLIPSDRVALTELVKNAYDADASQVLVHIGRQDGAQFLHVWDNGHGMDLDEILNKWLEIANPNRAIRVRSESGERRVLGAKGLGRFAAARLGSLIGIDSRRQPNQEVHLTVDWSLFSDDEAYLADIPIDWTVTQPQLFASDSDINPLHVTHGTLVRITDLRHSWEESEISDLRIALSRLLQPHPHPDLSPQYRPEFEIQVIADQHPRLSGPLGASETLNNPKYQLIAIIGEDGEGVLTTFTDDSPQGSHSSLSIPTEGESCGPLELDIRAWDLDTPSLRALAEMDIGATNSHDVRRTIRENSGIAIYRDGFRVQPYGDADNDWLNLDLRRVNNPTLRLSNNQVSGFIFTSADENPDLRDQSNRLGLIENESYSDLKNKVVRVLAELEKARYGRRRGNNSPETDRQRRRGIFDAFRLDEIKNLADKPGDDEALRNAIERVEENIAEGIQEIEESISRFSRLATLGSLVDIVLHDGRTALLRMSYGEERLQSAAHRRDFAKVISYLESIQEQADVLDRLFSRIEPLSGRKRGRPRSVALGDVVNKAFEVFHAEMGALNITTSVSGGETTANVDEIDILQVLVNLVGNSVYWLNAGAVTSPKIDVTIVRESEVLQIAVSDNGPGVQASEADRVFDPYYTSKPEGMGLGLAIAGAILQDFYNGALEQKSPGTLGGATFTATLRRRIGV